MRSPMRKILRYALGHLISYSILARLFRAGLIITPSSISSWASWYVSEHIPFRDKRRHEMVDEKTNKRIQDFIERMKKERGYLPDQWAYLAEEDIDFMEAYDTLYKRAMEDDKALPAKMRELVCIGVLAHIGLDNAVVSHIKRALAWSHKTGGHGGHRNDPCARWGGHFCNRVGGFDESGGR